MAVFNEPNQWEHPLGNNADTSTLPDDAAATAGIASLQKLFQIINATPLEAGGIAPDREDVNALFKYLGDQIFYTQNGGIPSYNAAYDYIPGRVVLYTDNNLYKCIQANGASSTVVAPGTDEAYWQQLDKPSSAKADKDFSNVTAPVQAFKDMSIGWLEPDYSSVYQTTSTSITLPKMSWVYCYGQIPAYEQGRILVDGVGVTGATNVNGDVVSYVISGTVLIPAGKTITFTGYNAGTLTTTIIPCKGAN